MKRETQQTWIGLIGLTVVEIVALHEGFNGYVAGTYFTAMVALIAPEALEYFPLTFRGGK